jgi:DNA-binding CsgD family transcriptional regulator/tetratricopeptide (TPR) repeat protein
MDDLRPTAHLRSALSPRVVGRDAELSVLLEHVDEAAAGRGGVVFLVGEAGIGKSRLAQAAVDEGERRGFRALRGRAVPAATPIAYRAFAEALSSAIRADPTFAPPELAPFRAALGRLIPQWRAGREASADDSVVALAEAVLRLLRAIAGSGGCLAILEDLHWADPETLTIVEYLADNLLPERVLCIVTLRDEPGTLALDLARGLHARRASDVVELSRLDPAEVAEMVASCLDTDDVPPEVVELAERAEGIPFLVEELLAVAIESGALVCAGGRWELSSTVESVVPFTFADSIRRRLAQLSDDARTVLLAAAVLGRRFEWDLLPAITGLEESAVATGLHRAVNSQLVAVDAGAFRFRHALSRDAVLGSHLPPDQAAIAGRALEAIERAHPGLPGEWCELAAEIADAANAHGRAAGLLLEAGRRAMRRGALATAERTLDRAAAVAREDGPAIIDIEETLTETLSLAGKCDRAMEVGASLLVHVGHSPDRAGQRAQAQLRLARAAVAATRWDDAVAWLDRAAVDAANVSDETLGARIDALRAQIAIIRHPERSLALAQRAFATAERLDLPDVACEALEIEGRVERRRDLVAAADAFARAYAIADANDLTVWRVRALHELGTVDLLDGGDLTRLVQARDLALRHGALATAAVVDVQVAAALAMRDDPEPATTPARRAADLARRYRLDQVLAVALAFEAHVQARARRRDAMEDLLAQAAAVGGEMPDLAVIDAFTRSVCSLTEEDRVGARRELARAVVPPDEASGDQSTGPAPGLWALLLAVDGEPTGAEPCWPETEPTHFMARGLLRFAEAVVAGRRGDVEAAVKLVLEGDRVLGELGWYRHLGHRLVAEATMATTWAEPVGWLQDALTFFEANGDNSIASACRSLLRKAGTPAPRRRASADVPAALRTLGMTPRELEVLRLLAQGLPNKEIGRRLYLSPRTVERHIANLTVKAGLERRAELVAFAARSLA